MEITWSDGTVFRVSPDVLTGLAIFVFVMTILIGIGCMAAKDMGFLDKKERE